MNIFRLALMMAALPIILLTITLAVRFRKFHMFPGFARMLIWDEVKGVFSAMYAPKPVVKVVAEKIETLPQVQLNWNWRNERDQRKEEDITSGGVCNFKFKG